MRQGYDFEHSDHITIFSDNHLCNCFYNETDFSSSGVPQGHDRHHLQPGELHGPHRVRDLQEGGHTRPQARVRRHHPGRGQEQRIHRIHEGHRPRQGEIFFTACTKYFSLLNFVFR